MHPSKPESALAAPSVSTTPRVVLFSYHFHPSSEVGAKRTTALARHLATLGARPIVVSAFGGHGLAALDPEVRTSFGGMTLVGVAESRNAIVEAAVWLKGALRRRTAAPRTTSGAGRTGASSAAAVRPGMLLRLHTRLHRWFFGLLHIIDGHKQWTLIAACRAVATVRRDGSEVVFVSGPPMSTIVGAAWIGRRTDLPVVVDLRDPCYPNPLPAGADSIMRLGADLGLRVEAWAMKRAAAVVCTSAGLATALKSRYPYRAASIHCIPNGFDDDATGQPPPRPGVLSIVFAGALYVNRDPFAFLEAVDALASDLTTDIARIRVLFVGECAEFRGVRLRDWLGERRANAIVEVRPPVSSRELDRLYADATVLLNFAQGQPLQVPAKTFEQLASGRELILVSEATSDTARMVAGIGGVHRVDDGDRSGMLAVLRDLYRRHVVDGTINAPRPDEIQHFSRATQNERLTAVLAAAAKRVRRQDRYFIEDESASP